MIYSEEEWKNVTESDRPGSEQKVSSLRERGERLAPRPID